MPYHLTLPRYSQQMILKMNDDNADGPSPFREFLETSTVRGITRIYRNKSRTFRILCGLFVCVSFIGAIYFSYSVYYDYKYQDISVVQNPLSLKELGIPVITICEKVDLKKWLNVTVLFKGKLSKIKSPYLKEKQRSQDVLDYIRKMGVLQNKMARNFETILFDAGGRNIRTRTPPREYELFGVILCLSLIHI